MTIVEIHAVVETFANVMEAINFRQLRGRMRQQRVAALSGVPQSSISKLENGKQVPIRSLLRVLKVYCDKR